MDQYFLYCRFCHIYGDLDKNRLNPLKFKKSNTTTMVLLQSYEQVLQEACQQMRVC